MFPCAQEIKTTLSGTKHVLLRCCDQKADLVAWYGVRNDITKMCRDLYCQVRDSMSHVSSSWIFSVSIRSNEGRSTYCNRSRLLNSQSEGSERVRTNCY